MAALKPLDIGVFNMWRAERSVGSTPVGAPALLREMFRFAARRGIAPVTEHFQLAKVNDALDHLRAGKARYRIVLDRRDVAPVPARGEPSRSGVPRGAAEVDCQLPQRQIP